MDFASAERYLLGTINEATSPRSSYRLERMREFLRALGDPQERYPIVHVGGTSGKGSTSTMIAAALQSAGKRVGLHTKPHLRSMTERARIDMKPIDEDRFAAVLTAMMPAIERVAVHHGRPTYYETLLALAFLYFAEENADVAAIEVGLGGRLDGTNLVHPVVAAITSIGYDHMDVLGGSLEAIAAEKAGIAKPGIPLVVAVEDAGPLAVIESEARRQGAPIVLVQERSHVDGVRLTMEEQRFDVLTEAARYHIRMPLLGEFQRRNAATAIVVLEQLRRELRPTPGAIERAFASLTIPGRMELVPGRPAVLYDIAHNAEKAEHLAASLRESFPGRGFVFVVAIGESKDAREILRRFTPLSRRFVFTSFTTSGRHALAPDRLVEIGAELGIIGSAQPDAGEALARARSLANPEDVVVVTGSTFIVAMLREWRTIAV
jgi:dihydrofolate synthase / folylpolyglutamate synthase